MPPGPAVKRVLFLRGYNSYAFIGGAEAIAGQTGYPSE